MLLALALLAPALAGTVLVETAVATEVFLQNQPVVKTFGAAHVALPGVPAGRQVFVVWRDGRSAPVEVDVPEDGTVRVLVGKDTLGTDRPPPAVADPSALPPVVEFRAAPGEQFSILVDGERRAILNSGHPLRLEDLGVGQHALEIRSADLLVVWVRGSLDLEPGDALVVSLGEGRMAEVFGRAGAWQPGR